MYFYVLYFPIYKILIRLESSYFHKLFAQNWKVGKRMAEHGDDASRINVLKAIWSAPRTQEMENGLEREIWAFKYDLGKMEAGVKHLLTVANDQLNRVGYIQSCFTVHAPFNCCSIRTCGRGKIKHLVTHSVKWDLLSRYQSKDIERLCESIFICVLLFAGRPTNFCEDRDEL